MKTSSHSSPDRSVLVGIAKWFTLAIAATLALALGQSAQAQMVLINPTTLNGSFEGSSGYFCQRCGYQLGGLGQHCRWPINGQ